MLYLEWESLRKDARTLASATETETPSFEAERVQYPERSTSAHDQIAEQAPAFAVEARQLHLTDRAEVG